VETEPGGIENKFALKGNKKMSQTNVDQYTEIVDEMKAFTTLPMAVEILPDRNVENWLAELSPDTAWGDRQIAAKNLGCVGSSEALPGLLNALSVDPFWMVRCTIIQALERIGDPAAIPTLREVAKNDGFQVVRSYATKALERLS
jgi:HEAT repeat protein